MAYECQSRRLPSTFTSPSPFLDFKIKHCDRDTSSQETGGWHWPWLCWSELPWQELHRNKNPESKAVWGIKPCPWIHIWGKGFQSQAWEQHSLSENVAQLLRVILIVTHHPTWAHCPGVYFLQVLFLTSTPSPWLPKSSPRLTDPCLLENSANCGKTPPLPPPTLGPCVDFYILCFLIPFLGLNYDYTALLHRVDFK